jgi:hypothetical protein
MLQPATHQHTAPALPPWLRDDPFYQSLPEQHQQAIGSIIQPLYERFVLRPADHLERSTGSSVIYLLWSELLKQAEIANTPFDDHLVRRMLMDDLFLILGPKSQMSSLLVRLRQATSEPQHDEPPLPFPFPAATLTADIGETQPPLTNTESTVVP